MARPTRTLRLATPLDVESLWHALAATLPALAQVFGSPTLAPIEGPSEGSPRRYECSAPEANAHGVRVSAHVDLLSIDQDGQTFRSISLNVVSSLFHHGRIVLDLWDSGGDRPSAIDELSFECDADAIDAVRAALRSQAKLQ